VQTGAYLQEGEASVILPNQTTGNTNTSSGGGGDTSAPPADGSAAVNSTEWLGCIVAPHAVMGGKVVALLDGVQTPEECCRACRQWPDSGCNVFNTCQQLEGCR